MKYFFLRALGLCFILEGLLLDKTLLYYEVDVAFSFLVSQQQEQLNEWCASQLNCTDMVTSQMQDGCVSSRTTDFSSMEV